MPSLTAAELVKNALFVESLMTVTDRDFRIRSVSPPRCTFHSQFEMKPFENPLWAWIRIVPVLAVKRAMLPARVFVISIAFFRMTESTLSRSSCETTALAVSVISSSRLCSLVPLMFPRSIKDACDLRQRPNVLEFRCTF